MLALSGLQARMIDYLLYEVRHKSIKPKSGMIYEMYFYMKNFFVEEIIKWEGKKIEK